MCDIWRSFCVKDVSLDPIASHEFVYSGVLSNPMVYTDRHEQCVVSSLSQLVHQDRRHSQTGIYCEWIKGSSSERPEVTVNTLSLVLCESREVVSACIGKHASQKAG